MISNQIYYHFLSAKNALIDLERKMIRVSTLDTLNDPFELLPNLRHDFKKRQTYQNVRNELSNKWGLLCFSRTWREPLLWSHYANNHTGIALGFNILDSEKIDVEYWNDPIRKQIELTNDKEENEASFLSLAKIKYKKWEYEEESRLLVKLDDCLKLEGHFFVPFKNRLEVKQIRLGAKYNYKDTNEDYICKLAKELNAEVIPSRLQWQGYKINIDGRKNSKFQKMLS